MVVQNGDNRVTVHAAERETGRRAGGWRGHRNARRYGGGRVRYSRESVTDHAYSREGRLFSVRPVTSFASIEQQRGDVEGRRHRNYITNKRL